MFKAIIICVFAFLAQQAFSGTITGTANWQAVGNPGFLRINGEGASVAGDLTKDAAGKYQGVFKVKLADYTTGMALRDQHMKDKYLDVAKFPFATLKLDAVAVSEAEFPWVGTLEIKGETRPVKGTATFKAGKLNATFAVELKDYPAIGVPSHLGVTVADKVNVVVEGELK